jgi:hypothetical protein
LFLFRVIARSKIIRRTEFRTALFGIQTLALLPSLSSNWPSSLLNGISFVNSNLDLFAPGKTFAEKIL